MVVAEARMNNLDAVVYRQVFEAIFNQVRKTTLTSKLARHSMELLPICPTTNWRASRLPSGKKSQIRL